MAIVTRYYPNVYPEEGGVFRPLITCDLCGKVIKCVYPSPGKEARNDHALLRRPAFKLVP